jgi:hypothetical protein
VDQEVFCELRPVDLAKTPHGLVEVDKALIENGGFDEVSLCVFWFKLKKSYNVVIHRLS